MATLRILIIQFLILFWGTSSSNAQQLPRNIHNTDTKHATHSNTCWMNNVIQCLHKLKPLKALLKTYKKRPATSVAEKKHRRIVELFKNTSASLRKRHRAEDKFFPRKFYASIINTYFPGTIGSYNNSSRFLNNFLLSINATFETESLKRTFGISGSDGSLGYVLVLYPWQIAPPRTLEKLLAEKAYSLRTLDEMEHLALQKSKQKYTKTSVGQSFDKQGPEIDSVGKIIIVEHMKLDPDQPDDKSHLGNSTFSFPETISFKNIPYHLRSISLYAHGFHYVALVKSNDKWHVIDALAATAVTLTQEEFEEILEGKPFDGYYPYLLFYEIDPLHNALFELRDNLSLLKKKLSGLKEQLAHLRTNLEEK